MHSWDLHLSLFLSPHLSISRSCLVLIVLNPAALPHFQNAHSPLLRYIFLNTCTFVSAFSKSTLLQRTSVHRGLKTLKHKIMMKLKMPIFNASWVGLYYSSRISDVFKVTCFARIHRACNMRLCLKFVFNSCRSRHAHVRLSFAVALSKAKKSFIASTNASRPTQGHLNYLRGRRLTAIMPELCFRHGSWYYFLEHWEH